MWRRFFCFLAAVLVLSMAAQLSFAQHRHQNQSVFDPKHQNQYVFGPIDLTINRWHHHLSRHTFHVDHPGSGVIVVSRNKHHKGIWKGFLLFNGRLIPLHGLHKKNEITIPIKVQLKDRNYLKVCLIGRPGASVRIGVKKACCPIPPPTITFSVDPPSISLGESAILNWETADADSVTIDNDIGTVDSSGSATVSPSATTTYTLTATGPGGTTTATAAITVLQPPAASIDAEPGVVHAGESSTLAWTSANADSLSIDQGIGPVDPVGSITVSPLQTTTYTLTAVNSDGTTTASATIVYENTAPVAAADEVSTEENISVTTGSVLINDSDIDGDTLIISAFSQAANGTVISHGDGRFTYTPNNGFSGTDSFSYTISDGQGGSDTGVVEIQVVPGVLTLEITSPTPGQEFTTVSITVTGSVNRPGASIFVNGIAATVSGNEYTADSVPLVPGTNTISVLAEDGDETQVAGVTVMLLATIDLEPIQIEISSNIEDDGAAKVSGQAMVIVANNGSTAVSTPYRIVLFEDTNLNQSYEEQEDNRLGETTVAAGPGAGEAINASIEFTGQLLFRDNRMHVFVDSGGNLQETDEENNSIASRADGIDVSASLLEISDAACPDESALTVRIGNAGDASIPGGVPVAFYDGDPANGGTPLGTVSTIQPLDPGQYEDLTFQWFDPPAGITVIYARADDDGTGVDSISETDEGNNLAFAEMAVCTAPSVTDGIVGQAVDALTGDSLSGTTIFLHADQNGVPGTVVDQTASDSYGGFAFSRIDPGTYILVADREGYFSVSRSVVLAADELLTHQDMVLSPLLNPGEFRIVLTWGEHPADLEAHLTAPNPDGCRFHCFYWNRNHLRGQPGRRRPGVVRPRNHHPVADGPGHLPFLRPRFHEP